MVQVKPKELVNALGEFVKANREDQLGPHQSLYAEIWRQWQALDKYSMDWADGVSQDLSQRYWRAMGQWYQSFNRVRRQVMEPALAPSAEVAAFYLRVVRRYANDVQGKLPVATNQQPVAKINDFAFRLRQQLVELEQLDTAVLTMLDIQLLIEYWHMLAKVAIK